MNQTSKRYFRHSFVEYNAIQRAAISHCDEDVNIVVASPPATGKTAIAESCIGGHVSQGHSVAYICPYRSLAKEIYDRWSADSQLSGVFVQTSDGVVPEDGLRRVGIMTCESFYMQCIRADWPEWKKTLSLVVVDEAHFIGDSFRGPVLEAGIMAARSCFGAAPRLVLMSGTIGNAKELARWAKSLNGKPTFCFESTGNENEVEVHFETVRGVKSKVARAVEIVASSLPRRCLVFVHSKKIGRDVRAGLKMAGVMAAFHNASLEQRKRADIESAFREGRVRALVSTSTLGAGVNLT